MPASPSSGPHRRWIVSASRVPGPRADRQCRGPRGGSRPRRVVPGERLSSRRHRDRDRAGPARCDRLSRSRHHGPECGHRSRGDPGFLEHRVRGGPWTQREASLDVITANTTAIESTPTGDYQLVSGVDLDTVPITVPPTALVPVPLAGPRPVTASELREGLRPYLASVSIARGLGSAFGFSDSKSWLRWSPWRGNRSHRIR